MKKFISAAALVTVCLSMASLAQADNIAYAGSSSGAFGTMDLNTGVFTRLATRVRLSQVWPWLTVRYLLPRITPPTALYSR